MISYIPRLSKDLLSICLMSSSTGVLEMSLTAIKERFDINSSFVLEITKDTDIKSALSQASVAPLLGSRWLVIIDLDELDSRQVLKQIHGYYRSCLLVYKTSYYARYKKLISDKKIINLASYNKCLYLDTLSNNDIAYILAKYTPSVDENLVKLLADEYSREPDSILEIGVQLQAGKKFRNRQDLISAVGLGNISIAGFVLRLLTMQVNTIRGYKTSLKHTISYLNYLYQDLESYSKIKNYVLDTLSGFIDIKIAMIQGTITHVKTTIPEFKDEKATKRFKRLFKYRFVLENSISLEKLLKYKLSLENTEGTPEQCLLLWIMSIYNSYPALADDISVKIDTRVPLNKKFRLSDYDNYGNLKVVKIDNFSGVQKSLLDLLTGNK